jgi:hypothetical protein
MRRIARLAAVCGMLAATGCEPNGPGVVRDPFTADNPPDLSGYADSYSGTFTLTGFDSGTWSAAVNENGEITGSATSPQLGEDAMYGSAGEGGSWNARLVVSGIRWRGTIDASGNVSGTLSGSGQVPVSGTFSGSN